MAKWRSIRSYSLLNVRCCNRSTQSTVSLRLFSLAKVSSELISKFHFGICFIVKELSIEIVHLFLTFYFIVVGGKLALSNCSLVVWIPILSFNFRLSGAHLGSNSESPVACRGCIKMSKHRRSVLLKLWVEKWILVSEVPTSWRKQLVVCESVHLKAHSAGMHSKRIVLKLLNL